MQPATPTTKATAIRKTLILVMYMGLQNYCITRKVSVNTLQGCAEVKSEDSLRRGKALALIHMGLAPIVLQAYLSVTQSLGKFAGKTYIKKPKASSGKRRAALPPSLTLVLQQHRLNRQELFGALGKTELCVLSPRRHTARPEYG
jgi:hypothetical protein